MSKLENIAIQMENISKTYISGEVKVEALKDISINILKGERIVILGPSGSGKTTLLNLLGGITLPDINKDNVHLVVFNNDIKEYNHKELTNYRRDRVGFIFQFFNLFPSLNALDNIVIAIDLLNKKLKKNLDVIEIAKEYLSLVGLKERLYHYPAQLSGGEQQRVAIARALAKIPFIGKNFILLCDEPTGNLDTETGEKIIKLMTKINEDTGITIIMVTHNIHLAEIFGTNIIHLRDGTLQRD